MSTSVTARAGKTPTDQSPSAFIGATAPLFTPKKISGHLWNLLGRPESGRPLRNLAVKLQLKFPLQRCSIHVHLHI